MSNVINTYDMGSLGDTAFFCHATAALFDHDAAGKHT